MHEFTAKSRIVREIWKSHTQLQEFLDELERSRTRVQVDSGSHFHSLVAEVKEKASRLFKEIENKEWQLQRLNSTTVEILRREAESVKIQEGNGAYMDADRRRYRFQNDSNDLMTRVRGIRIKLKERLDYLT